MKILQFVLLFLSVLLFSCNPDDKIEMPDYQIDNAAVLILNQGNFTYGNASLSAYNKETGNIVNQVFYQTNVRYLGDVGQSITQIDDRAFIVVNNSAKIEVVNVHNLKSIATITGFVSPRNIMQISENEAVVSDLYDTKLSVINLSTYQVTASIELGKTSENMLKINDKLYLTNWSFGSTIQVYDLVNSRLETEIPVVLQPNSMVLDKNNKLWVLSDGAFSGSSAGHENAALQRINIETNLVEQTFVFDNINSSPTQLKRTKNSENLYFIDENVYKMHISDNILPLDPFIKADGKLFFSMGIDPENEDIYLSDAIDYQQAGAVFRYNSDGELLSHFQADVIPGFFLFPENK